MLWYLSFAAFFLFIAYSSFKDHFSRLGILVLSYFLLRPWLDFVWPRLLVPNVSPVNIYNLQTQALLSYFGLFFVVVLAMKRFLNGPLDHYLAWLGVAEAFAVVINGTGLLGNTAQDSCVVAVALPLIWRCIAPGAAVGAYICICIGGSAAAQLASIANLAFYSPFFIPVGVACAGILTYIKPDFWWPNGRLDYWWQAWEHFKNNDWLLGWGPGSYFFYGPAFNLNRPGDNHVFAWLHNDYLEILFGYGAIGFVLFLGFIVYSFYISRNYRDCLGGLACLCVIMLFQMPLRQPLFWFFIIQLYQRIGALNDQETVRVSES